MAKAIAAVLHHRDAAHVTVYSRNTATGAALANRYGFSSAGILAAAPAEATLINATPLCMHGTTAGDLAFPLEHIHAATAVIDVVAFPADTGLGLRDCGSWVGTVDAVGAPAPPSCEAQESQKMIHTTVYVSTLAEELTGEALEDLLDASRGRNEQIGITGMLVVRGRRVMQMLEGEQSVVRRLYDTIAVDTRHHDVITVWSSSTARRRFPDWSMAFDDLDGAETVAEQVWTFHPDSPDASNPSSDDVAYVRRRDVALRRAFVSGEQLVVSLAIILQGHRPEGVLGSDGAMRLQCAECHPPSSDGSYPCNTARNALWGIESTLPQS